MSRAEAFEAERSTKTGRVRLAGTSASCSACSHRKRGRRGGAGAQVRHLRLERFHDLATRVGQRGGKERRDASSRPTSLELVSASSSSPTRRDSEFSQPRERRCLLPLHRYKDTGAPRHDLSLNLHQASPILIRARRRSLDDRLLVDDVRQGVGILVTPEGMEEGEEEGRERGQSRRVEGKREGERRAHSLEIVDEKSATPFWIALKSLANSPLLSLSHRPCAVRIAPTQIRSNSTWGLLST